MTDSRQLSVDEAPVMADAQPRAHATRTVRARRRPNGMQQALTSKQQLATTIKSVRDLLRKDAGLSGDTDRLPQLTWLLFLKAFDDFEYARAEEQGDAYAPIIAPPYRWRDWADVLDKTQRLTGDELLEFVNARLIPHLSEIAGAGEHDIRTMVGTIFQGTYNRIRSGYILREVVDKLSTINFNASEDIHTVSVFYETMLREMRNAAGDAGEFYTPRPVVRFIVDRLAPKLGERVLDPACGTCGFLVETYERLRSEVRTPEQRELLPALADGHREEADALPARRDEYAPARHRVPQYRRAQCALDQHPADPRRRPSRGDSDQPAVRWRGGARHPQ